MGLSWLASYPKSGNTWTRALLTAYFGTPGDSPALNGMGGGSGPRARVALDHHLGLDSSLLRLDEIELYHPDLAVLLSREAGPEPRIVKVHAANTRNADGRLLFPADAGRGVYVARNPLDVAASFAPFFDWTPEHTAAVMADAAFVLNALPGRPAPMLPERLLSWSGHVRSWLDGGGPPVYLLRYEDLHADPAGAFAGVLAFMGVTPEPVRLRRAVEQARFARLQVREAEEGFAEHALVARTPFFRRGRPGAWRDELPVPVARRLVRDHRDVMLRLGYGDTVAEVEALPAAGASPSLTPDPRPVCTS